MRGESGSNVGLADRAPPHRTVATLPIHGLVGPASPPFLFRHVGVMHALDLLLRRHGGIASLAQLRASPTRQRALARAAERGTIRRVRRGVYAVRDAPLDVLRAATIGGRLTGVSALRHYGLWVPPRPYADELHVEVRVAITVFERRRDARVHWTRERTAPQFGVAPLESVLARAASTLPRAPAVAVLDSALRSTPMTPVELLMESTTWRPAARAAAALADERSESGTESVLRVLLLEAGIPSTPQPALPTGDHHRADLLIGDRLLIECDSEAHHAEPSTRRADAARDALLTSIGFIVLRYDYRRVFNDPAGVIAEIAAVVERGDHVSAGPTHRP